MVFKKMCFSQSWYLWNNRTNLEKTLTKDPIRRCKLTPIRQISHIPNVTSA